MATNADQLSITFLQNHPETAANVLEGIAAADVVDLLVPLPIRISAAVIKYMPSNKASQITRMITAEKQSLLFQDMGLQHAALILRHFTKKECEEIIMVLPTTFAIRLRLLLQYPSGSVGSVMNPDIIIVVLENRVSEVIGKIQQLVKVDDPDIYIVDKEERFMGCVQSLQLLQSDPQTTMASLLDSGVTSVPARMSLEALIEDNQWVARQHLPVVDRNQHLVGSISFSDVKGYQPPEEIIFQEERHLPVEIVSLYWKGWLSILNTLFANSSSQRDSAN